MKLGIVIPMAIALMAQPVIAAGTAASEAQVVQGAEGPAVDAARALLDALDGTPGDRTAFLTRFTAQALQRESASDRQKVLDRLATASGGFEAVEIRAPGPRMAEAIVRSRLAGRFGKVVVFVSKADTAKIADLFVLPERDPALAKRLAWPTQAVPVGKMPTEIDRRVTALAREGEFSGVVLVAHRGKRVFHKAYGFADQEWGIPNAPETLFHSASIGKMFTAVALLRLVEQGRVSLDDSLGQWVPEFGHPDEARRITLRQLLTHRAGLGEWDGRNSTAETAIEAAASMKDMILAEPGASFAYSNAGYVLLGAVIEKVTAKPFDQATRDLVFVPSGMKTASFPPVSAVMKNRATGYLRPPGDPLGFGPRRDNAQFLGWRGDASGGAYLNAGDLLAFHHALETGVLLKPDTFAMAIEPVTDMAGAPEPWKYGLGFRLADCSGTPTYGHSGGGANSGVSNATYSTRDGEWTIVVLSNYDPAGEALAGDICRFVARK